MAIFIELTSRIVAEPGVAIGCSLNIEIDS
jgi:hypothetical protein